jgi:hypothetical protein
MPINEYPSGASFPGVIGRTADESTPTWPTPVRAPKDAPNVLFIAWLSSRTLTHTRPGATSRLARGLIDSALARCTSEVNLRLTVLQIRVSLRQS